MTRSSSHIICGVRISLMIVFLGLGLAASAHPASAAGAACSETAAGYPMLIGAATRASRVRRRRWSARSTPWRDPAAEPPSPSRHW
jgi:hypothetical protein